MGPRRSERGQTLPLVALCVVTLMIAAALGIDIGQLAATNRRLQAVADLAAIDGARELTGTSCDDSYVLPTDPTNVPSNQYDHVARVVTASAARNDFVPVGEKTLGVELGFVTRDTNGVPSFNPLVGCGADVPDAVRVRAGDHTSFSFGTVIGHSGRTSNRFAVGNQEGTGEFTLGSSLVTMDASRSALLNPILSQALCRLGTPCTLNLSAAGYQGLIDSEITFGALASQLGFGTTSELLSTNLTIDQILTAAAVLADPTTTAGLNAQTALGTITTAVTGSGTIKLRDMVSAELANGNEAASTEVNLYQLVLATAAIANGTNAVTIPNTAVTIPGVSSITASISLIEAPITIGRRPGATATTKQFSMTINPVLSLTNQSLSGLTSVSATGSLPTTINAGAATGTLTRVRCGTDRGIDTTVSVAAATMATSGTLNLSLGTTPNKALLQSLVGSLGLVEGGKNITTKLSVSGTGATTAVGTTAVSFAYPGEFGPDGTQHVGNTTVGLDSLTYGSANLAMSVPLVSLLGISLGTTTVNLAVSPSAIVGLLDPVLSEIDQRLVKPLMELLGLDLGSADVWANSMQCGVPGLAG